MNEQKIEDLKNAVRTLMEMIVQRGKPLSPELKAQLQKLLDFVAKRITQLREEEGQGAPPIPEPIPGAPYPSSNINSFKYDPKTGKLLVKFMGKDVADAGPTYKYEGVPPFIVDVFARGAVGPKTTGKNKWHAWFKGVTPSHGAAMNALIKMGGFPYQRVA